MPARAQALRDAATHPCSITRTLSVVSDPWSFLILRDAFLGTTRFADFRRSLGIASDVLSARLGQLVDAGVLERVPYSEPGQRSRYAYEVTRAGEELKVVLGGLQQWGDEHLPVPVSPTVSRHAHDNASSLRVAFVDGDGRVIEPEDADFIPTETYPDPARRPSAATS